MGGGGGGRLFEAGRLLTFSAFSMGAYSRLALIRGWALIRINTVITDRIGRHEVLLPINHNFNKICNIIGYFLNQNTRNSKFCFARSEKKKPFKRVRDGAY